MESVVLVGIGGLLCYELNLEFELIRKSGILDVLSFHLLSIVCLTFLLFVWVEGEVFFCRGTGISAFQCSVICDVELSDGLIWISWSPIFRG